MTHDIKSDMTNSVNNSLSERGIPNAVEPSVAIVRVLNDGVWSWYRFTDPVETVVVDDLDQVRAGLDRIESLTKQGLWAVGMVSYDAGPAMDSALTSHRDPNVPLLAFGLYNSFQVLDQLPEAAPFSISGWQPTVSYDEYIANIGKVKNRIAAGDTYQVNYTYRLRTNFEGDPSGLFVSLAKAQPSNHIAFLDLGRAAVCSASPELFFVRSGPVVTTRPMKGTRPRHFDPVSDQEAVDQLLASEKDRAENTMIVDMARNDLGRVAEVGTVAVPDLHTVETYPTVHQLTSTVTATVTTGLSDLMAATFPAASIVGAPKVSTCSIIAELESTPRGVYTGAIGVIAPNQTASFNVAIRTAWIDRVRGTAEYGIGGGIVWDSDPDEEWKEAIDKARILHRADPNLKLLETMRWDPRAGVRLLDRHLSRLESAANHFGVRLDVVDVKAKLNEVSGTAALKLRLLVDLKGHVELEEHHLPTEPIYDPAELSATQPGLRVCFDTEPIDPRDEFLYHKTTNRKRYEQARSSADGFDDVVLWNPEFEITETAIGNIVVLIDGRLLTPAIRCGLLPGTMRADLLAEGTIEEATISIDQFRTAEQIFRVNSVHGWQRLELTELN